MDASKHGIRIEGPFLYNCHPIYREATLLCSFRKKIIKLVNLGDDRGILSVLLKSFYRFL